MLRDRLPPPPCDALRGTTLATDEGPEARPSARLRRGADGAPGPRGHRGQPVPRAPAEHAAPTRLRRPGRRAGTRSCGPHRARPLPGALAALLLPAPGRHLGPDRV